MDLIKKLIKKKYKTVNIRIVTFNKLDIISTSNNKIDNDLMMHMLYREGETDAKYEIENDDYGEKKEIEKETDAGFSNQNNDTL